MATAVDIYDLRGLNCPMPVLKARKKLSAMAPGSLLWLETTDPLATLDIPAFCSEDGHRLVETIAVEGVHCFLVERGERAEAKPACEFRPPCEADYDAIAEIWHSSASLPGVGPVIMPTEAELRSRLDVEFAAGWKVTLAVQGDEIVGFLAIRPDEAVLAELFVRPGSIRAGIGRALLGHAMAAMPDGFTLYTRATNENARRFYEKAGLAFLHDGVHPRSGDAVAHYGWNAAWPSTSSPSKG